MYTGLDTDFIGTCDDTWEVALCLPLTLDHSLDNTRVIGPQINEDISDAGLPKGLEKGKGSGIHAGRRGSMVKLSNQ